MKVHFSIAIGGIMLFSACQSNVEDKADAIEQTEIVEDSGDQDFFINETEQSYGMDWMKPESVVKTMIRAAGEKDTVLLTRICTPPGTAPQQRYACYALPGNETADPYPVLAKAKIEGSIVMATESATVPLVLPGENRKVMVSLVLINDREWHISSIAPYKATQSL